VYFGLPIDGYSYFAEGSSLLRIVVHQREIYPYETWDWLSADIKKHTNVSTTKCPVPCDALQCHNVPNLEENIDLSPDRGANILHFSWLVLSIALPAAGMLLLAMCMADFDGLRSKTTRWIQKQRVVKL
jgi:hypothetical protein